MIRFPRPRPRPRMVVVTITTDDYYNHIDTIAENLYSEGLNNINIYDDTGIITGRIDQYYVGRLRYVTGVVDVEEDRICYPCPEPYKRYPSPEPYKRYPSPDPYPWKRPYYDDPSIRWNEMDKGTVSMRA